MPDKRRGYYDNDPNKNTDDQSTMYIPSDSEDYRRSAQGYSEQYFGEAPRGDQYYEPQTQYYSQEPRDYAQPQPYSPADDPERLVYDPVSQQYVPAGQSAPQQQEYGYGQANYTGDAQYFSQGARPAGDRRPPAKKKLKKSSSGGGRGGSYEQAYQPRYRQSNQPPPQQYYSAPQDGGYAPPPPPPPPPPQAPPPPRGRKPAAPKKKKRHKSLVGKIIRRVVLSLLSIFLVLFGVYSCTSLTIINKINYEEDGERIRNEDAISSKYVTSVLLIGTDGRSDEDKGRSASMILVSFNRKTNKTVLTSFMRDVYAEIPGYGWGKLNWAYSYGGAELLMDTIERNFDVKIDDYVSINFATFAALIDAAGGIDIEISDEEANEINVILRNEVNEIMGDPPTADFVEKGGDVHLNGKQALCYSRIRHVGNSDFERTSRQRRVMTELIKKAAKHGPSFIKNVSKTALPHLTTNMTKKKLYLLSLRLPFFLRYDTKQIQIPAEGTYSGENVWIDDSEQSVLKTDFDANYDIIAEEIFDE